MEMVYVDSTSIDQIGYDEEASELHVVFKNGRAYVYSGVGSEVWNELENASSKGSFINQEIKGKGFAYRQI